MADPLHSLHWLLVVVSVVGVMVVVVAVGDIWSRETRSRRERKKERGIRKRSEKRDQIVAKQIKQGEITHSLIVDGILIRAYSSPYHTNTQILNTGSGRLTEPLVTCSWSNLGKISLLAYFLSSIAPYDWPMLSYLTPSLTCAHDWPTWTLMSRLRLSLSERADWMASACLALYSYSTYLTPTHRFRHFSATISITAFTAANLNYSFSLCG